MKLSLASVVLLCCGSLLLAQEGPTTQPSTKSTDEEAFRDAVDPSTSTWSSAMPGGFAVVVGYKSVKVKQSFSHNTNPEDSFLPNANVPGSAGTTRLNRAQFVDFGFRYELPADSRWSFHLDATGLFAFTTGNGADASGMNLDDRQNANDSRPAALAAFVYTDANYGFDVALGVNYSLSKDLYLGASADFAGVFVESGWDRYSSYKVQSSKLVLIPAGGPTFGWRIAKDTAIEGSVLFGKNGIGYTVGLVCHF
jgi:hypothetical protein